MHYKIRVRFYADIMIEHPEVTKLYYDALIPSQVLDYADENSKEYHEIVTRLNSAFTRLNLLKVPSKEFYVHKPRQPSMQRRDMGSSLR